MHHTNKGHSTFKHDVVLKWSHSAVTSTPYGDIHHAPRPMCLAAAMCTARRLWLPLTLYTVVNLAAANVCQCLQLLCLAHYSVGA